MFDLLRRRRRARLRAASFPESWRAILSSNVPIYDRLSADAQRELHGHIHVLLAEKNFEGCGGLEVTDEIRVTIAAHAGLLMLGREPQYYPGLYSILVYPSAYRAPLTEHDGGIVTESEEARHGESWRTGAIVLAWDVAHGGARDVGEGENVILHEFAHQLDTEDGAGDGVPYLDRPSDYVAWARALAPEYERLRERPHESLLDLYGAESPAEFFAVATEAFFENSQQLRDRHPELYAELRRFFRLDPAAEPPLAVTPTR
jgi:Mlc titration factor MtfA (ptsG expression regulator)